MAARIDFAAETVFSHPSKVEFVEHAQAAGYDIVLHVLMVPLAISIARVEHRAAVGGHTVPGDKLAPRYERIWPLVVAAVPHCHRAVFYDNTRERIRVVASYDRGVLSEPSRWPAWTPDSLRDLTSS